MQLRNITVKEYMACVIYDQTNAKNISIIWREKRKVWPVTAHDDCNTWKYEPLYLSFQSKITLQIIIKYCSLSPFCSLHLKCVSIVCATLITCRLMCSAHVCQETVLLLWVRHLCEIYYNLKGDHGSTNLSARLRKSLNSQHCNDCTLYSKGFLGSGFRALLTLMCFLSWNVITTTHQEDERTAKHNCFWRIVVIVIKSVSNETHVLSKCQPFRNDKKQLLDFGMVLGGAVKLNISNHKLRKHV